MPPGLRGAGCAPRGHHELEEEERLADELVKGDDQSKPSKSTIEAQDGLSVSGLAQEMLLTATKEFIERLLRRLVGTGSRFNGRQIRFEASLMLNQMGKL